MLKFICGLGFLVAGIIALPGSGNASALNAYLGVFFMVVGLLITLQYLIYLPAILPSRRLLPKPRLWQVETLEAADRLTDFLFIIGVVAFLVVYSFAIFAGKA